MKNQQKKNLKNILHRFKVMSALILPNYPRRNIELSIHL